MEYTKPACFGISICFDSKSATCARCVFRSECVDQGKLEALEIAREMPAQDLVGRFAESKLKAPPLSLKAARKREGRVDKTKFLFTLEQERQLRRMTGKTRELAESVFRRGINLEDAVIHGPSLMPKDKLRHLSIAIQMLRQDGFSRQRLIGAYMGELQWTERTAASAASIVIGLLLALNLAKQQGWRIVRHDDTYRR